MGVISKLKKTGKKKLPKLPLIGKVSILIAAVVVLVVSYIYKGAPRIPVLTGILLFIQRQELKVVQKIQELLGRKSPAHTY